MMVLGEMDRGRGCCGECCDSAPAVMNDRRYAMGAIFVFTMGMLVGTFVGFPLGIVTMSLLVMSSRAGNEDGGG